MEPETSISLRKAAAAFGPCAGGTRHALRKIIDRLETDEHFWREIAGDKNHWRTPCITMELAPSSDWFRLYSSLSDQHPIGMDDNFDHFRDQIEHLLYESDDLVVDYDQVRLIWIPDNFDDFAPNAKLLSSWSFIQSVAWVANRYHPKADHWIGKLVAQKLSSHGENPPSNKSIENLVNKWINDGFFKKVEKKAKNGNTTPYLEVDKPVRKFFK